MTARLWHMGRDLQSRLKGFFETPLAADAAPLELLEATLDELERRIQPAGRGRRIFPYDRIVVRVAQAGADAVALNAVFAQLAGRLRERLQELRCEAPDEIDASVAMAEPSAETPLLEVECFSEGGDPPLPQEGGGMPSITVTVVKGQCTEPEYVFDEPIIAIGRTADPTDAFGQVRHNHVAFLEERDGINETVGRAHARVQFDSSSGHYHLFNEASSNPTSIIRAGKTIRVAPRDPRGVRICSGDQLQLGRALLKVVIGRD